MERGSVLSLYRKVPGGSHLEPVEHLAFTPEGLADSKTYSPLRQVLIVAASDASELGYLPGELHENIVADFPRLQDLASGSVLAIGEARIRLTFHCEPCATVRKLGSLTPLMHRRGVLGQFLNAGTIRCGDSVRVTQGVEEPVPYEPAARIAWYLAKRSEPISASRLLFEVGLPRGYARALPAILRKLPFIPAERVVFASRQRAKAR